MKQLWQPYFSVKATRRGVIALAFGASCFVPLYAVAADKKEEALNPVLVAQSIAERGEDAVIRSLSKDAVQWKTFTASVARADQAWINIGLLLLPHAKGRQRRDLRLAFEEALAGSPKRTVASISSISPNLSVVCGPSAHETYDLSENSIDQRISAIGSALLMLDPKTDDPRLWDRLSKCGDFLDAADQKLRDRHQAKPTTVEKSR